MLDNQAIWLSLLIPTAWGGGDVSQKRAISVREGVHAARAAACVVGFGRSSSALRPLVDRLGIVGLSGDGGLAAKLHHEYYWLSIVPVVAIGDTGAFGHREGAAVGGRERWVGWARAQRVVFGVDMDHAEGMAIAAHGGGGSAGARAA